MASAQLSRDPNTNPFQHPDRFVDRHIGPSAEEQSGMLTALGLESLADLVQRVVPESIRAAKPLALPPALSEHQALSQLRALADRNQVFRSYIGMGYHDCITPGVIQRNILENPGWYTQYTPYQAEIAQGRLEGLLTFQTMVCDLTGLPVANASLLDEATAAAEAMHLCFAAKGSDKINTFFIARDCHPQTIDVVRTRAEPLGIRVVVAGHDKADLAGCFGALVQYPATDGVIHDYRAFIERAHAAGALVAVAADLLSLALLTPPGEFGADIALGNSQRFGVPLGFGGPHAAFFACRDELKRQMPGRIVGISKDSHGRPALRLSLQTREQHIRREKATSNICTAQALLANMAAMYAVYHGPKGLRAIAQRVHALAHAFAQGVAKLGFSVGTHQYFDTVRIETGAKAATIVASAAERRINLRQMDHSAIVVALDETTSETDVLDLLKIFNDGKAAPEPMATSAPSFPKPFARASGYLAHEVFNKHHSETEMLRYLRYLEGRDLSLTHAMIPLGSCTMKLNATAEMLPVSWPEFSRIHPFAPEAQTAGYREMFAQLERWLAVITGFTGVSLQPNAGSQGEYAGLLAIRAYHAARDERRRNVCLIPTSAHGTNPASAVMAGMRVIPVQCDAAGNIDVADLEKKAKEHANELSCLMVTYPSTHGVFEERIKDVCAIVHRNGGQVYMDGANMNAQVGLCSPGEIGADVCHLNLHKTFCIPHGGGGPGMGPIGVAQHLVPYLPKHPNLAMNGGAHGAVSAAPWGSASILPISWTYIAMMGPHGLTRATEIAILNANYIAKRLSPCYKILYQGKNGLVAHECIIDLRPFKAAGIEVEDVAKRLMDYGFHAPTMSFPVPGTMMIEPTESESKEEIDRFCAAMIGIHAEIAAVADGKADKTDNVLKNAPHTAETVVGDQWTHPYSREQAAFPIPWNRSHKFWPAVGRIDNAYGDRNLICTCPSMESYS